MLKQADVIVPARRFGRLRVRPHFDSSGDDDCDEDPSLVDDLLTLPSNRRRPIISSSLSSSALSMPAPVPSPIPLFAASSQLAFISPSALIVRSTQSTSEPSAPAPLADPLLLRLKPNSTSPHSSVHPSNYEPQSKPRSFISPTQPRRATLFKGSPSKSTKMFDLQSRTQTEPSSNVMHSPAVARCESSRIKELRTDSKANTPSVFNLYMRHREMQR